MWKGSGVERGFAEAAERPVLSREQEGERWPLTLRVDKISVCRDPTALLSCWISFHEIGKPWEDLKQGCNIIQLWL